MNHGIYTDWWKVQQNMFNNHTSHYKKFIFTVSKQPNIYVWARASHITSDLFTSFDVVSDKEIPNGFPQIIQNPGMKVVEKGRNTVLVCEAGGDPKPTITWIKVKYKSFFLFSFLK